MQCTVNDRMVDRTAHGCFVGRLHGSHDQYASGLRLCEKRTQQLLFLLNGQVLATATARSLTPQYGLPLTKIVRMHLSHRTHLPAEDLSNLRGS